MITRLFLFVFLTFSVLKVSASQEGIEIDGNGMLSERHVDNPHFRSLKAATKQDFDRMGIEYDRDVSQKTIQNMLNILESQKGHFLGASVTLYEHNLQTASRALRGREDDETVVMSLFHDMFETLAVKNHGELVAAMLAPWISPKSHWVLAHHEVFQGHYYFEYYGVDKNKRNMFIDHPYYNWTVEWCEKYDQASFDPAYESLPLESFLPAVERVLARPQYWWNPAHPKAGAVSADEQGDVTKNQTLASAPREICDNTWECYVLEEMS